LHRIAFLLLLAFVFCASAAAEDTAKVGSVDVVTQASWREPGTEEKISADELRKMQLETKNLLILDARAKKPFDEKHIAGARLPLDPAFYALAATGPAEIDIALQKQFLNVAKDTPIVTYCTVGCKASAVLFTKLLRMGFRNVKVMEEGIQGWESKGYPVETA
jgi:rhodanese-related sulfurtransferase